MRTLNELIAKANHGDPESMFILAEIYEEGTVVPQNIQEAITWYQRSSRRGYAIAYHNLALIYAEAKGNIKQDDKLALLNFEAAADLSVADSAYNAGLMYLKGWGTDVEMKKAVEYFQLALACIPDHTEDEHQRDIAKKAEEQLKALKVTSITPPKLIPFYGMQSASLSEAQNKLKELTIQIQNQPDIKKMYEERKAEAEQKVQDLEVQVQKLLAHKTDVNHVFQEQQQDLDNRRRVLMREQMELAQTMEDLTVKEQELKEREQKVIEREQLLPSTPTLMKDPEIEQERESLRALKEKLHGEKIQLAAEKKQLQEDQSLLSHRSQRLTQQEVQFNQQKQAAEEQLQAQQKVVDAKWQQREEEFKLEQKKLQEEYQLLHKDRRDLEQQQMTIDGLKQNLGVDQQKYQEKIKNLHNENLQLKEHYQKAINEKRTQESQELKEKLDALAKKDQELQQEKLKLQQREDQLKKLMDEQTTLRRELQKKEEALNSANRILNARNEQLKVLEQKYDEALRGLAEAEREKKIVEQQRVRLENFEANARRTEASAKEKMELVEQQIKILQKPGLTPLLSAAERKDADALEKLLHMGFDVNLANEVKVTALHIAVLNRDLKSAAVLLKGWNKKAADPNLADSEGDLPLHYAARNNDEDMLNLLLVFNKKEITRANTKNRQGKTARECLVKPSSKLNLIAQKKYDRLVKLLQDAEIKIDNLYQQISERNTKELTALDEKKKFMVQGLLKGKTALSLEDKQSIVGYIGEIVKTMEKGLHDTLLLPEEKKSLIARAHDYLEKVKTTFGVNQAEAADVNHASEEIEKLLTMSHVSLVAVKETNKATKEEQLVEEEPLPATIAPKTSVFFPPPPKLQLLSMSVSDLIKQSNVTTDAQKNIIISFDKIALANQFQQQLQKQFGIPAQVITKEPNNNTKSKVSHSITLTMAQCGQVMSKKDTLKYLTKNSPGL